MLKTILPIGIIAVLAAILAYMFGINSNKEKIERLIEERSRLEAQKEAAEKIVEQNSKIQDELNTEVDSLFNERELLKKEVANLEVQRAANQLSIRHLRNADTTVHKFIDTYPPLNENTVFLFEHSINPEGTLKMTYVGLPSQLLEKFMIEHDQSIKYLQQKTALDNAVKLDNEIFALKDSIYVLEKEKFEVYKIAYEDAYNAYMKINKDYIDELKKPKFDLLHWGTVIGGTAAGYLMGKIK